MSAATSSAVFHKFFAAEVVTDRAEADAVVLRDGLAPSPSPAALRGLPHVAAAVLLQAGQPQQSPSLVSAGKKDDQFILNNDLSLEQLILDL